MKDNKNSSKKHLAGEELLEEFLGEEGFDEEDEDTVTDDTLEFLCLDDEMIESARNGRGRTDGRKASSRYDEEEDDEELEEEDFEEDEDFDGEEDDEDFDDDEYDDEDDDDDEYDYDEDDGVFVRFRRFLEEMTVLDMIVAMLGIVVIAGVIVSGSLYVNARNVEKQIETFASVGEQIEGVSVIGESGLVAVSESARLAAMIDLEEPEEVTEQTEEKKEGIEVTVNLTSVQSDLKIKFVNKATGKLIGSVPFTVEVSNGKKTFDLKDEDKDGIIYQTGLDAGTYQVTAKPFKESGFENYLLPSSAVSVKVTDTIAYKKVEVADEVKTEAEVNAAVEDTAKQDTAVESALQDTVEWVESTKTLINSDESYEEISKDNIPDPSLSGRAGGFMKIVETGGAQIVTTSETEEGWGPDDCICENKCVGEANPDCAACGASLDNCMGREATSPEEQQTCTCDPEGPHCTDSSRIGTCPVCREHPENCVGREITEPEQPKDTDSPICNCTSRCTSDRVDQNCPVCKEDSSKCKAQGEGETNTPDQYSVAVSSCPATLSVGGTGQAVAKTTPEGGTVAWSSSDEKIVKIVSQNAATAELKGIAAGTATITVKCGDASATCKVTVEKTEKQVDSQAKLKDKNGNQVYIRKDGGYVEATYADYYADGMKFYLQKAVYSYTGWQTIDGYVYYYDKNGNYVTGEQVIQGARYNFGSDGRLSQGSGTMGIDVSKWNGNIDWNAVKNSGVSYVIIRCGYRGSSSGALIEDPKFRSNIKGAKAAGLKVGVYFFSQAVNEVEAVLEASMAIGLVSGYGLDYPIFLDVESSGGRGDGVSREMRTAVCKAFCATVQDSGYSAGIYANKTWFTEKINTASLTGYKIWLAQYASAPTYTATRHDMWQYSSKGRISGINGNVDMNISYMAY